MLNMFQPVEAKGPSTEDEKGWPKLPLAIVYRPMDREVYIEWGAGEPMENVIALIHASERAIVSGPWEVVFDADDDELIEALVGGYRLHGMFVADTM